MWVLVLPRSGNSTLAAALREHHPQGTCRGFLIQCRGDAIELHKPVILALVLAFVPLRLLIRLPRRIWQHIAPQYTHLLIDGHDRDDERFWGRMPSHVARLWGCRLMHLTSVTLRQPLGRYTYKRGWGIGALISILDGHSSARQREREAGAEMDEGSLTSIAFECFPASHDGFNHQPPAVLMANVPIRLPALTSMTGVHDGLKWLLLRLEAPSIEMIQGDMDANVWALGPFLQHSTRLKRYCVPSTSIYKIVVFNCIRVAAAGQPGPLSQLQDIGRMGLPPSEQLAPLQNILFNHGCRSLSSLDLELQEKVNRQTFSILSAVTAFVSAVCRSPDIPITWRLEKKWLDLSLLHFVPIYLSPLAKKALIELARQAHHVEWSVSQTDIDPDDADSQPPPHSAIAKGIAASAFPRVTELWVGTTSSIGWQIGGQLATKTPSLSRTGAMGTVRGGEGDVRGFLSAIGRERALREVRVNVDGADRGGIKWGEEADTLPTIKSLRIVIDAPDGVDSGDFGRACVASLVKLRGLQRMWVLIVPRSGNSTLAAAMREHHPQGTCRGFLIQHRGDAIELHKMVSGLGGRRGSKRKRPGVS
ncbi:unnamed protein product [Vitrella brassicaformis CCMP3155]|uniref:Uncharacterized protein n=1 Tax=Vitrella brassicaformis (strain CCMP3155) TaxID=1169540 RepID=A0A0G4G4L3_VITBC|nr:unnamed protein product [Vitrella brassicaformis CCMP3155]|eukprot:CEM23346.1 unnamed protein product [Vitrella brassicaformis CCMP3155]